MKWLPLFNAKSYEFNNAATLSVKRDGYKMHFQFIIMISLKFLGIEIIKLSSMVSSG